MYRTWESVRNGEELEESRVTGPWHALVQTCTGTEAVRAEGRVPGIQTAALQPSIPVLHGDAMAQEKGLKGRLQLRGMSSDTDWVDLKHEIWAAQDRIFGVWGF